LFSEALAEEGAVVFAKACEGGPAHRRCGRGRRHQMTPFGVTRGGGDLQRAAANRLCRQGGLCFNAPKTLLFRAMPLRRASRTR
jgi:hypothetical protein